jgi:hypothetical protein
MASVSIDVPDVFELSPPLVLLLWDGFTGSNVMAGDIIVQIGATKPQFQAGPGQFVFAQLANGSYTVSVKSAPGEPYYAPASIPVTLPFPRPADTLWNQPPVWIGYPDIVLADPDKTLVDPGQTAAYLGQRALATLSPTTAYPFPAGTTLLRGLVAASGEPLSGALVTTSPLAQPGQYSVVVSNPSGVTSAAQSLTVVNAPVTNSIDPLVVIAGAAAFTLAVEGSGFASGAVLKWNASPLPTTFLDGGTLMAQISADLVAAAAQVTLIAVNPDGTSSNSQALTVANAPTIVSINPRSVAAGSPGFTLRVQGSGFVPGAVVQLRSTALATTWLSSTLLQAQVLPGQVASAAQMNVAVKNPGPRAQSSNVQVLAVASTPVINSLEPAAMVAGSAAFTLTVVGSGFVSGAVVKLGGTALPTTFQSANELTAQVTAAQVAAIASLSFTVSNPNGTTSDGQTLAVTAAPAISSLQPTSVSAVSAAFALVVRGTGFVSGSSVELNGAPLSTTFIDSTELDAHVLRSGYTTGADGTFVLFFDDITGLSQVRTVVVTHPSYPNAKLLDVRLIRGATVSVSTDMSS